MIETMTFNRVNFRGMEVYVTDVRIKGGVPNLYKYEIRHSDDDWGEPVTIEPHVLVNFYGTVLTPEPLTFENEADKYIPLTEEESESFASDDHNKIALAVA